MAQDYITPIAFYSVWFVLLGIAISMMIQGWRILGERDGYAKKPDYKSHPEIDELPPGTTGKLMSVTFKELEYPEGYDELQKRIQDLKMDELFDEPSTYEDDDDDGRD